MRKIRNAHKILITKPEGQDILEDVCTDDNIRVHLKKMCEMIWTRFIYFRVGSRIRLLWTE
jgi:hypothetical protein